MRLLKQRGIASYLASKWPRFDLSVWFQSLWSEPAGCTPSSKQSFSSAVISSAGIHSAHILPKAGPAKYTREVTWWHFVRGATVRIPGNKRICPAKRIPQNMFSKWSDFKAHLWLNLAHVVLGLQHLVYRNRTSTLAENPWEARLVPTDWQTAFIFNE